VRRLSFAIIFSTLAVLLSLIFSASAFAFNETQLVNTAAPTISGYPVTGGLLEISFGTWTGEEPIRQQAYLEICTAEETSSCELVGYSYEKTETQTGFRIPTEDLGKYVYIYQSYSRLHGS
jgi:hypothetical protein